MANLYSEKPIVKVVMLKGQDGEEKLINQADGSGVSLWIGTKAEYDAIPEEELVENCIYYITDDTRDDFTTALNALDTKVDNHYTELSEDVDSLDDRTTANETVLDDITYHTADGWSYRVYCAGVIQARTNGETGSRVQITVPLTRALQAGQTVNITSANINVYPQFPETYANPAFSYTFNDIAPTVVMRMSSQIVIAFETGVIYATGAQEFPLIASVLLNYSVVEEVE